MVSVEAISQRVSRGQTQEQGTCRSVAALLAICVLVTGCVAGVRGGPIYSATPTVSGSSPTDNDGIAGIRYFLPALYLIVQKTPEGTLSASLEVMADSSQLYYVEPYVLLAKQDADIVLNSDGTLQSFKLEQDGAPVSAAIISAFKDVALKKLELEKTAAEEAASKGRHLSQRDVQKSMIWVKQIVGGRAFDVQSVSASVPPRPEKEDGGGASGQIEGKFAVTLGGGSGVSKDQKLVARKETVSGKSTWKVTYEKYSFSKDDVEKGEVQTIGIAAGKVRVDSGALVILLDDIPATGAALFFRGDGVVLSK